MVVANYLHFFFFFGGEIDLGNLILKREPNICILHETI